MIVNNTYEAARLDAIHILSAYDKFPVTITITPHEERNGQIKWYLDYEERDAAEDEE